MPIFELQTPTRRAETMTTWPSRDLQNVVEENLFKFLLDLEVQKATRLQYCLSVVCMTPDLRAGEADGPLTKHLAGLVARQLRATDIVTTFTSPSLGLLLIDAEIQNLPRIHQRVKEELEAHPLTVGGREWHVTWSAGGSCFPLTASSGSDLVPQAMDLMTRAKREGVGLLYLPS